MCIHKCVVFACMRVQFNGRCTCGVVTANWRKFRVLVQVCHHVVNHWVILFSYIAEILPCPVALPSSPTPLSGMTKWRVCVYAHGNKSQNYDNCVCGLRYAWLTVNKHDTAGYDIICITAVNSMPHHGFVRVGMRYSQWQITQFHCGFAQQKAGRGLGKELEWVSTQVSDVSIYDICDRLYTLNM